LRYSGRGGRETVTAEKHQNQAQKPPITLEFQVINRSSGQDMRSGENEEKNQEKRER